MTEEEKNIFKALITEIEKLRGALSLIEQMSDAGSYETAIAAMKSIATDALKK